MFLLLIVKANEREAAASNQLKTRKEEKKKVKGEREGKLCSPCDPRFPMGRFRPSFGERFRA